MKKGIFSMAVLAAMCVGGYFGHSAYQESKLTDLELANVEALSENEGGNSFNCGRAAYEWSEGGSSSELRKFMICRKGCPETNGINPSYIDCIY